MNILTDKLPKKIKVNDNIYDINYDYKTIIRILIAFEDIELTKEEKAYILLKNLYKTEIPEEDIEQALIKGIKFIDGGETVENEPAHEKRVYSFTKDSKFIFSGISQTHSVDLSEKDDLHWWVFLSLFMDMSSDCTFGELVYYRKRKNENKLTKEEKEQYKKIKKIVDLDDFNEQDEESRKARKEFFKTYRENKEKLNKK